MTRKPTRRIERDEPKFGAYWTVYADHAEKTL